MTTRIESVPTGKKEPAIEGMALQVQDLTLRLGKPKRKQAPGAETKQRPILSELSFPVQPGQLLVITGPERLASSALLKVLAGILLPSDGEVLANGVELHKYRKAFCSYIGYVPRESSLHEHLTLAETLNYKAKLLLPRQTTRDVRRRRVAEALYAAGIEASNANRQVGTLGKLERQIFNIAVELVHHPGLLLVDAQAEPLDPVGEMQVGLFLKELARQGFTVVWATDQPKSILTADKTAVLAPDGTLAWFGPPAEAVAYFREQAMALGLEPDPGTPEGAFGFEELFLMLQQAQVDPGTWKKLFEEHPGYQDYVDDPLNDRRPNLELLSRPLFRLRGQAAEKEPPPLVRQPSLAVKASTLFQRDLSELFRSRVGKAMLLAPPLVGLLDFLISTPDMLDPVKAAPNRLPIALGLLVFLVMLLATFLFQSEIWKEREMIRRERRSISMNLPYILSKVGLVGLMAVYQGVIWAWIHAAASRLTGGWENIPVTAVTLVIIAFIGGVFGLIASSLARTGQAAPALALLLVLPQFLLSGSVLPLPQLPAPFRALALANPLRYGFESLLSASGYGKDLAEDRCWQQPEEQRASLSEQETALCACTGENIFLRCNFPGIARFSAGVSALPQPEKPDVNPSDLTQPVQPVYKEGETLEEYVKEVNEYTLALEQFQGTTSNYMNSLNRYVEELNQWQQAQSLAIGKAEEVIAQAYADYGGSFQATLASRWLALIALSAVLVVIFGITQMRKDGVGL